MTTEKLCGKEFTEQESIKEYMKDCIYSDLQFEFAFEDLCCKYFVDELIINELIKDKVIDVEEGRDWLTKQDFPPGFHFKILRYLHEIPSI